MADTKAQHIMATLNRVQKEGSQWCVNQTMWGEKYWIISVMRHWLKPGSNWIKLPFICSGLNNRLGGRRGKKKKNLRFAQLFWGTTFPHPCINPPSVLTGTHVPSLNKCMETLPSTGAKTAKAHKDSPGCPRSNGAKGGEKIFCSLPRWDGLVRPLSLDTRQVKERLKLENSIYLIISQNN